jgi:hypothetical protein
MGQPPASQPGNVPSVRYQTGDQRGPNKQTAVGGVKRPAPPSSNVTSADSSDLEDDENGELPASGLVAPWEVLRGLADVAIERAAKVGFDIFRCFLLLLPYIILLSFLQETDESEPHSRTRTPSPERDRIARPSKRRKLRHKFLKFTDGTTSFMLSLGSSWY